MGAICAIYRIDTNFDATEGKNYMQRMTRRPLGAHPLLLIGFVLSLMALAACQPVRDPAVIAAEATAMAGGQTAAAPADESTPGIGPAMATIAAQSLRVRALPSDDAEVVAGVKQGETYKVIGISSDGAWIQIEIEAAPEGTGWVSAGFVTLEGDITNIATVDVDMAAMTPTAEPTEAAMAEPTAAPTEEAMMEPTEAPTEEAMAEPTAEATRATPEPTEEAMAEPTAAPTEEAMMEPTEAPTEETMAEPTAEATSEATPEPTEEAMAEPTAAPTEEAMTEAATDDIMTLLAADENFSDLVSGVAGRRFGRYAGRRQRSGRRDALCPDQCRVRGDGPGGAGYAVVRPHRRADAGLALSHHPQQGDGGGHERWLGDDDAPGQHGALRRL